MIKKVFAGCAVWGAASAGLLISKSGSNNDIVFGNYSDYIAPSVAEELKDKYGLRVDLFDYDHLVKERFEKGTYDMAIVSTSVLSELKSTNSAMKLDWSKLIDKSNEKTSKEGAKFFTEIVQNMSGELLDYGIPYFIQKLGFYYRGTQIDDLQKEKPVSFKKLVEVISKEERFKSKDGKHTLGLIDDPRTVLSLARKVSGKEDVNPNEHEYKTSDEIFNSYKELVNKGLNRKELGNNFLFMHSDSGPLVDALSSGSIQGAFMYNGDGYFAADGGNGKHKIKKDEFHSVELSENIYFLDFLSFSAKMPKHKQEDAYKLAKELIFITEKNKQEPFKEKTESKSKSDEDETEYEETAIQNFNFVGYTPTLEEVYSNLKKGYFGIKEPEEEEEEPIVTDETKYEILRVEMPTNGKLSKEYEKQLTPQQKSDMLIAYSEFKSLL